MARYPRAPRFDGGRCAERTALKVRAKAAEQRVATATVDGPLRGLRLHRTATSARLACVDANLGPTDIHLRHRRRRRAFIRRRRRHRARSLSLGLVRLCFITSCLRGNSGFDSAVFFFVGDAGACVCVPAARPFSFCNLFIASLRRGMTDGERGEHDLCAGNIWSGKE